MLTDLLHLQSDIRTLNGAVLAHIVREIRAQQFEARHHFGLSLEFALALGEASSDEVHSLADVEDLIFVLSNQAEVEARLVSIRAQKTSALPAPAESLSSAVLMLNLAYLTHVINMARADIPTACVRCGLSVSLVRRLRDVSLAELNALACSMEMRFVPRSRESLQLRLGAQHRAQHSPEAIRLIKTVSGLWGVGVGAAA